MIQFVPSYKVSVNAMPVPLIIHSDVYPLDLYDLAVMFGVHTFKDGPPEVSDRTLEERVRRAAKQKGMTVVKSRKHAHRTNARYQVLGGSGSLSTVVDGKGLVP